MLCPAVLHAPGQWMLNTKHVTSVLGRHSASWSKDYKSKFSPRPFLYNSLSPGSLEAQSKRPLLHFQLKSDSTGKRKHFFYRLRLPSLRRDLSYIVSEAIVLKINGLHLHCHHQHHHFHHFHLCSYFYCCELHASVSQLTQLSQLHKVGIIITLWTEEEPKAREFQ